jgi:DNA repair protein RadD
MNAIIEIENEKKDRWYQTEAVDNTFKILLDDEKANPLIGLPTASGKSHTMCMLIDRILSYDPTCNVLVLCGITNVVKQNHADFEEYFCINIGLYSSKLKSKTIKKITCAGIQSVHRKPELFKDFDFVIVDEVHEIPENEESMYRSFFSKLYARFIGLSATLFRMKGGYIHEGENALFNTVAIDLTTGENYLRLVREGHLCPIYSYPPKIRFDTKGLKKEKGDFSLKDQSKKFDIDSVTRACCAEIAHYGKNYNRWIGFAIDINHAENIKRILEEYGIKTAVVHSKMLEDFETVINDCKSGVYRCLVNVDMLTTGYNDPQIDLGFAMFCTQSPNKHVQTMGRLGRTHPSKKHALWLDFGTNIDRLGSINEPLVLKKGEKGNGEPVMKSCPECNFHNFGAARICWNCEHIFEFKTKLTIEASKGKVIKDEFEKQNNKKAVDLFGWCNVDNVFYAEKQSKVTYENYCIVSYKCGLATYSENLFFNTAKAQHFSKHWIQYRWDSEQRQPTTLVELLANTNFIVKPAKIRVDRTGKYPVITDYEF